MSSFYFTAVNKLTREEIKVFAHDDYFGQHEFGYRLPNGKVLKEETFYRLYERNQK